MLSFCPQITWTRKTDYHLLTVGLATYTVDQRFVVEHVRHQQVRVSRVTAAFFLLGFSHPGLRQNHASLR